MQVFSADGGFNVGINVQTPPLYPRPPPPPPPFYVEAVKLAPSIYAKEVSLSEVNFQ